MSWKHLTYLVADLLIIVLQSLSINSILNKFPEEVGMFRGHFENNFYFFKIKKMCVCAYVLHACEYLCL